MIGFVVFVVRQ